MLTLGGLGTVDTLLEPGPGARLGVARTDGDVAGDLEGAVAWVLVEGGTGALRLDDETTTIDGREDVFDRAGWSAIVGEGSTFALVGDVRATVVWRSETRPVTSRVIPPDAVGMQMRSESDDDGRGVVVRDGRIERITSGWHPVVAAPGSTLYYLWALAGADSLETEFDARYA